MVFTLCDFSKSPTDRHLRFSFVIWREVWLAVCQTRNHWNHYNFSFFFFAVDFKCIRQRKIRDEKSNSRRSSNSRNNNNKTNRMKLMRIDDGVGISVRANDSQTEQSDCTIFHEFSKMMKAFNPRARALLFAPSSSLAALTKCTE